MNRTLYALTIILSLSGCGSVPATPASTVEPEASGSVEIDRNRYQNARFGYEFWIPDGVTVYALTPEQTAVPAQAESDVVFLVDGETNFFTVRGIEDVRTPHEWLTQNLAFFYPTGDAAQRVGEFAGGEAIFLTGTGTATSPAKLIVCSLSGRLLIISYEQDSPLFDKVAQSFSAHVIF